MRIEAVVLAFVTMCAGTPARAQSVIRVPEQFATIQAGVDAAQDGDTVLVGPGEWGPVSWAGKGITLRSTGGADVTIINRDLAPPQPVDIGPSPGTTSRIEGFTLRRGSAVQQGGGVRAVDAGTLVIERCVIERNTASQGGAIYLEDTDLTVRDSRVDRNFAFDQRGIIYVENSGDVTLERCGFYLNPRSTGTPSRLVYVDGDGDVVFDQCIGARNPFGQAVILGTGSIEVVNSMFEGLQSVFTTGGQVTVESSFFGVSPAFVDEMEGDLRLQPGSIGIDEGDASLVSPSATDLSGSPRVVRNPGETSTGGVPDGVGGRIDLGAYELQSDCDGDGMPDGVQLSEPFPGSGGRLRLDGLDDHALVAGFQGVPAGASTVEFWAATPAWSAQSAFAWRDCATDRVVGAMLPAPGGDVEWTSGDPSIDQSATLRHTASTYQRREGAWNHWAFVRDPATDTMRIYRNGRVVEVRSGTGMFDAGPTPLTIGAGAELFSGCATMPFRGMIDEFRVWGVARTGAEICRRCHRRSRAMRAV